ncbi:MAG: dockerin type I repeat-containing protein [Oscillospiraceae bacterium]|nr:dockerin type I repeat-containing protein [Oscillospiraceae bacterium]
MTKNMKKMLAFAVCGMLTVCCSNMPVQAADQTAITVTIDQTNVTLKQLKSCNYEIPIFVRLNQNAELNAVEFGIAVDNRCRFDLVTRSQYSEIYGGKISMDMSGVLIPGADNCAWMTWAQQSSYEEVSSNLVMLLVKIPDSAQEGDVYEVHYLAQSPVDETKKHLWFDYGTLTDYAKENAVSWTDGKICVVNELETEVVLGDVTLDGTVDILDVITINKAVMGKEFLTELQNKAADIDEDGKPTSNDSLMILKKIVGLTD